MTVQTQQSQQNYTGNGVTTTFAIPFRFLANSHISVMLQPVDRTQPAVPWVEGTNYSLTGARSQAGGTLTANVAPASNTILIITRNIPLTQLIDYRANDPFPEESAENGLDQLTMGLQQVTNATSRSLRLPAYVTGVSSELPPPSALSALVWSADLSRLENGSTTLTGDMLLRPNLAQPTGSSLIGFQQAGTGSVARTITDKLRETVTPQDFGATGTAGDPDGGYKIGLVISSFPGGTIPAGNYINQVPNLTLPLNKSLHFMPGASITNSGSGTLNLQGPVIKEANNPGGLTSWTTNSPKNFEGLAVEVGQPPERSFGSAGLPIAITGHINIPANAALTNHGAGIAGYADTASPTTAGVGVYGEGNSRANNALAWGINTRSQDNGFSVPVLWGAEIDLNVSNAGTTPIGVEVVGGSTVEPGNSIGFKVSPLNPFNTLKIRWKRAFMSDDGAAITGLELGSQQNQANSPSQDINIYYHRNSNVRAQCVSLTTDGSGNTLFGGGLTAASGSGPGLFDITGNPAGASPIRINGNNLGFFGTFPVSKGTVTGSKGGVAALDSLLTELARIGLITNSST